MKLFACVNFIFSLVSSFDLLDYIAKFLLSVNIFRIMVIESIVLLIKNWSKLIPVKVNEQTILLLTMLCCIKLCVHHPGSPSRTHVPSADPSWQGYTRWRFRTSTTSS